jgi:hypothetical protein
MLTVEEVIANYPFGKATAMKRGRCSPWPYVPVVDHGDRTEQIRNRAFATRDEAVAYCQRVLDARRDELKRKFEEPRYRALRQQYGLPTELTL